MSTILKALKKLENESSENDGLQQWPGAAFTRRPVNMSAFETRFIFKIIAITAAGIIIVIVNWIIITRRPHPRNSIPPDASHMETSNKAAGLIPDKIKENTNKISRNTIVNDSSDKIGEESRIQVTAVTETADYNGTGKIMDINTGDETGLKPFKGSWLKLQAISWSARADDSIAVINDRVIKEGGSVEGAVVIHIEKDYVIVKSDGENMKLGFGSH